jgi:hypothetical protein
MDFIADDVANWPQAVRANSDMKTARTHFTWAVRFEIYDRDGKLLHTEYALVGSGPF